MTEPVPVLDGTTDPIAPEEIVEDGQEKVEERMTINHGDEKAPAEENVGSAL